MILSYTGSNYQVVKYTVSYCLGKYIHIKYCIEFPIEYKVSLYYPPDILYIFGRI